MKIVLRVFITALGLLLAAYIIPGIAITTAVVAIIAAIILGLLNLIVKPILLLLTLPITIITLGLFTFVINAALFLFAAYFVEGFTVDGFVPALLGSVLVSIFSTIGNKITS